MGNLTSLHSGDINRIISQKCLTKIALKARERKSLGKTVKKFILLHEPYQFKKEHKSVSAIHPRTTNGLVGGGRSSPP